MSKALFGLSVGGEVRPDNLRARDLADLIIAVEEAVSDIAANDEPAIDRDRFVVGLVEVRDGSARLRFGSPSANLAAVAFGTLTLALTTRNYARLPARAISSLHTFSAIARRLDAPIGFQTNPDADKADITIIPGEDLGLPRHERFFSDTELYGSLERLGGAKPRAKLILDSGQEVYCDLSLTLARQIGHRIYDAIGLAGRAEWDTETWSIVSFRADKMLPYVGGSIREAFDELREASRGGWDAIEDVDAHINELRRG